MTRYDLVDFARINIFDISIFLVYLSLEDAINCFNNEGRNQLFFVGINNQERHKLSYEAAR